MKYTVKSGITCRFLSKNKQYILQDCGSGHLGFMDEQDLKIKVVSGMTYSYTIHIKKWYYT